MRHARAEWSTSASNSGSLADLTGSALAVSSSRARAFGWHIGDQVRLWLGDGTPATLRVAATYTRPSASPRSYFRVRSSHDTSPSARRRRLRQEPSRAPTRPRSSPASEEFARAYPSVKVLTRSRYQQQLEAAADKQSLDVYVLLAVIGIFCAMALVNAMTWRPPNGHVSSRCSASSVPATAGENDGPRRDADHGCVRAAIGSIIAAPGLAAFNYSLTGSAIPSVSIRTYGGLLAVYALLGFAAGVLPTRLALRMNPVKEMTAREYVATGRFPRSGSPSAAVGPGLA